MKKSSLSALLENRAFRVVAYLLLGFFILLLLNNYTFKTYSEKYCKSCHVMKPSAETHSQSRHNRVSCFSCHFRSSNTLFDYFRYLSLYKCIFSEVFKTYEKPLNLHANLYESIESWACLKCHTVEKNLNPRLGILINHEAHQKRGIACAQCHNRVAHDLNTTIKLTLSLKISNIVPYEDRTKMKFCMECHTGLKGQPPSDCNACHTNEFKLPYSCNACHSENLNKIKPRDHFEPDFSGKKHATLAKKGINYCLQCHESGKCNTCHQEKKVAVKLPQKTKIEYHPPASHFERNFMPKMHAEEALTRGKDYCFQCHKPDFCNKCHNGLEMPHPEEFKKNHGTYVRKEGFERKCSNCHKSRDAFCEAGCHHVGWKPSMGPMIKSHPQVVKASGVARCLTCHTSIYCAVCHVSGKVKNQFRR